MPSCEGGGLTLRRDGPRTDGAVCSVLQRGGYVQGGGNINMQPGLGIIPTLFGFQQNQGGCSEQGQTSDWSLAIIEADEAWSMPASSEFVHAEGIGQGLDANMLHLGVVAGQGGYTEPLTPEQQHQAFLSR